MELSDKVDRCLSNDGEFKVARLEGSPLCGLGTKLPCKYQIPSYETVVTGHKRAGQVYNCAYTNLSKTQGLA